MAGLRKSKKKDSGNPSNVLIIFLILFALLSIGVGGWTYSVFSQQADLEKKLADAKKALEPSKNEKEYYEFLAIDLLTYYGHDVEAQKAGLGGTSVDFWKLSKDDFFPKDPAVVSRFAKEKSYPIFKTLIDRNKQELDNLTAKGYKGNNFFEVVKDLEDQLKKAEANYNTAHANYTNMNKQFQDLATKNTGMYDDIRNRVVAGNAAALAEARKKSAEHIAQIQLVTEQAQKAREKEAELDMEIKKRDALITVLQATIARTKDDAPVPVPVANRAAQPHALMLDVSRGRPMWDSPVGKITRINPIENEVFIDVGSARGLKPQTTFNVFAAGAKNRSASGRLKGTIEVIRIIDANSSLARITSLYDGAGQEFAITDPRLGRVQREVQNPFRDGDLIFNMVFGLRVAIAGNINWEGGGLSDTPAEQLRTLQSFIRELKREGIVVDAYVDPVEAKLVGEIRSQTKLLVTGALMRDPDMDPHAKQVNEVIAAVRSHAIEQGMFMMSADTLEFVMGHRRARSANDTTLSGYRPSLPAAGVQ